MTPRDEYYVDRQIYEAAHAVAVSAVRDGSDGQAGSDGRDGSTKETSMVAHVITVSNQKGGTGKTTIVMNVAAGLAKLGYRALVGDADRQGTALQWASAAPEGKRFPVEVGDWTEAGSQLHLKVAEIAERYDFILIDCPPAVDCEVPRLAMMVSDLALVPIGASPPDVWATQGLVDLIETKVRPRNPDLKILVAVNRLPGEASIGKACAHVIGTFDLPVARVPIRNLVVFSEAQAGGCWIGDVKSSMSRSRAKLAINGLIDDIFRELGLGDVALPPADAA